jgi:hypothetical protein
MTNLLDLGQVVGDTGPIGPTGETGPIGPTGATGASPVKGVDYFTEEDIEEITGPIETRINNLATFTANSLVIDVDSETREPSTVEALTARVTALEAALEQLSR